MTQQEHRLMVAMLAQQFQVSMTLFEILKSRGVLEDDKDLEAFVSLPQASEVFLRAISEQYDHIARIAGVDVRLNDPPSAL